MAEKSNHPQTLADFIKEAGAEEIISRLDRILLNLVLLLRHEPEHLETTIHCYESLYHLKKLIQQQPNQ